MNIALSAIILILILLPGTTAISAYYGSLTNKASGVHIPFNELLTKGLVFSILIHSISVFTLSLFGSEPKLLLLYNVVSGKAIEMTEAQFQRFATRFLWYNLFLIFLAFTLSKVFKTYVQNRFYDLKYHSLKTTSYWFHMFGGRHLEEDGSTRGMDEMDFIYVDVLTQAQFLYSGRLADFNYSPFKDELENIVLANAQKRRVNGVTTGQGSPDLTSPKLIPGDALVIKASTIRLY